MRTARALLLEGHRRERRHPTSSSIEWKAASRRLLARRASLHLGGAGRGGGNGARQGLARRDGNFLRFDEYQKRQDATHSEIVPYHAKKRNKIRSRRNSDALLSTLAVAWRGGETAADGIWAASADAKPKEARRRRKQEALQKTTKKTGFYDPSRTRTRATATFPACPGAHTNSAESGDTRGE